MTVRLTATAAAFRFRLADARAALADPRAEALAWRLAVVVPAIRAARDAEQKWLASIAREGVQR